MGRAFTKIAAALVGAAGVLAALPAFAGAPMAVGGITSQPIGHYEFCQANPKECAIRSRDNGPIKMTGAVWRKIVSINAAVNGAVKPMSDSDIYGKDEMWVLPVNGVGDCEDYVLQKQQELNAAGIPLSDLLITVVRKPDGEGHAVLTVRTDKGDFVLDNLSETVSEWHETGYTYLKRQSSQNTGRWVSIRKGQTATVASVK